MLTTRPAASLAIRGEMAVLTLARPDRRNALNLEMLSDLRGSLEQLQGERAVRALVLEGSGDAFCTGLDYHQALELRRSMDESSFSSFIRLGNEVVSLLALALEIPTVAAVDGPAIGSGLGLALACDVVVATPRATFGVTHVVAGLHPDFGLTHFVHERTGTAHALELSLTGRILDAHDALKIGLVSRISPLHAFQREVEGIAARFVSAAPAEVAISMKRAQTERRRQALTDALAAEARAQIVAFRSPETLDRLTALRRRFEPAHTA